MRVIGPGEAKHRKATGEATAQGRASHTACIRGRNLQSAGFMTPKTSSGLLHTFGDRMTSRRHFLPGASVSRLSARAFPRGGRSRTRTHKQPTKPRPSPAGESSSPGSPDTTNTYRAHRHITSGSRLMRHPPGGLAAPVREAHGDSPSLFSFPRGMHAAVTRGSRQLPQYRTPNPPFSLCSRSLLHTTPAHQIDRCGILEFEK